MRRLIEKFLTSRLHADWPSMVLLVTDDKETLSALPLHSLGTETAKTLYKAQLIRGMYSINVDCSTEAQNFVL
jgi:hypothetical protein